MDVMSMKQIYKVHYNGKATENKPSDLMDIEVEEVGKCPCCGIATSPTFLEGFAIPHADLPHTIYAYTALYCTSCHQYIRQDISVIEGYQIYNWIVFSQKSQKRFHFLTT